MIQFLASKIFEKTKQIIEHFDEEPVLQKFLTGEAVLPIEKITFIDKYFSDAHEELFRGQRELKEKHLDSLSRFLNSKYQEGGRSADFAKRLLLPLKNSAGELQYTQENFRQWRMFALDLALDIKGPCAVILQTRDSGFEPVSLRDLEKARRNPESKKSLDSNLQTINNKFITQDGAEADEDELRRRLQARFKENMQEKLEANGFVNIETEIVEGEQGANIRAVCRDQFGDEFIIERAAEAEEDNYVVYEKAHPEKKEKIHSHEIEGIRIKGIRGFLAVREAERKQYQMYTPQASAVKPASEETRMRPAGASPKITGGGAGASIPQFGGVMKAKEKLAAKRAAAKTPAGPQIGPWQMFQMPAPGTVAQAPGRKKRNPARNIVLAILGGASICGGAIGSGFFLI